MHCEHPVRTGILPVHAVRHGTVDDPQLPCAGTEKPATSSALAAKKQTVAIQRDIVSFIEELLCISLTSYSGRVSTTLPHILHSTCSSCRPCRTGYDSQTEASPTTYATPKTILCHYNRLPSPVQGEILRKCKQVQKSLAGPIPAGLDRPHLAPASLLRSLTPLHPCNRPLHQFTPAHSLTRCSCIAACVRPATCRRRGGRL
jgi:hypothetical protein